MAGWYHYGKSSTVLIFIHGLFSSSEKCWTSSCNTHWPNLILEDKRFSEPSIFLADYHTSVGSKRYGIGNCSQEIFSQIRRKDITHSASPLEHENIVFVTHSAGGIVARHLIDSNQDAFVGKRVGLCLYASPSYGSKLASMAGGLSAFFGHKLGKELKWGAAALKSLDIRFRKLLTISNLDIVGFEAIENKGFLGLHRVVNSKSAARYFDDQFLVANADHSNIVKPSSMEAQSHNLLLDFMVEQALSATAERTPKISYPSLFDRYSASVEPYYLERDADRKLPGILSQYNVWLSGASGYGKTAAISRCINKSGYQLKYISLSMCIGFDVKSLLVEILRQFNPTDLKPGHMELAECIRHLRELIAESDTEPPYCLLIEEIPISDQRMFDEFSQCMYSVIAAIDQTDHIRLCLSSIYQPKKIDEPEMQKMSERLRVVYWESWETSDLESLALLISNETGLDILTELFFIDFEGSPRLLKNRFRDELSRML